MPAILHAIDYLAAPQKHPPQPVCVVFGEEPFLKRQVLKVVRQRVLGSADADFSLSVFEGPSAQWAEVVEELSTVAMFGGDKRLVVLEEADDFVSRHRTELEHYVARPKPSGVLVMDVKTWPSTTKLYKAVAASGLPVECTAPKAASLPGWLSAWARQAHQLQLPVTAAEMLIELVGPELGLLDQEIARLALLTQREGKISTDLVRQQVGSWRTKTTWDMLDAALAGDARGAMAQLDRLLLSGETPIGILGQIAASLRRFAAATRLVLRAEAKGGRINVRSALEQAGVKGWVLQKAEQQIRHLGRRRASQLYGWLLETDLGLKGESQVPPRLILERLILRLAAREERK
jgi:DNA polymerase-3 subunit delta